MRPIQAEPIRTEQGSVPAVDGPQAPSRSIRPSIAPQVPPGTPPPPGPRGLPFLGSMPSFARDPLGFLIHTTRRYGDIVDLGAFGRNHAYLVAHPDQLKYVLQENAGNYTKGENFKTVSLVVGNGLVANEGQPWRQRRRLVQPAFHRERIGALTSTMVKVIGDVVETWVAGPKTAHMDMSREMMKITQHVLLKALLDVDARDETQELMEAWDIVYEFLSARLTSVVKIPLGIPTPGNRRFLRAMRTLEALVQRIIRARRETPEERRDLLSLLMLARDADSGEGMSDRDLRDEIMTMFAGGFETSAVVLTWAWHLLGQHPDVEKKLHAELDSVLGGRTPTLEDVARLTYTRMVLDETLRLYPGAWLFNRASIAADMVGGYPIAPGSLLFISPYVTHRHPEFWPDADTFDPERFSPQASAGRPRFAYFPFGGGPRQCLGDTFAITEMVLTIAMVAQRFKPRTVDGYPVVPQPMFTLRTKYGVMMTLEARSAPTAETPRPS